AIHCPGCPGGHGRSLEVQALQILKDAGALFNETAKVDRAKAFEDYVAFLMANNHILVGAHVLGLDKQARILLDTHQMIGAPRKRTEAGEEAPMDMMARWLNGID